MSRSVLTCVVASFLLASSVGLAGDGAIPIWEPTTITEPGYYVLTRNVKSDSADQTIRVESPDVHLDLNGFTVENTGGGYGIYADSSHRFTVRNGTLLGGGVHLHTSDDVLVTRLFISQASHGIQTVWSDNTEVSHNVIEGAQFDGIHLESDLEPVKVIHNTVRGSVEEGIYIRMAVGGLIAENLVRDCRGDGIHLRDIYGCRLLGNIVEFVGGKGMNFFSSDANLAEDNLFTSCSERGLYFDIGAEDNVYRGNISRDNAGGDFLDTGTGNTSHGDNYMPDQM